MTLNSMKTASQKPVTAGWFATIITVLTVFQLFGGWAFAVWVLDSRMQQNIAIHNNSLESHSKLVAVSQAPYTPKEAFDEARKRGELADAALLTAVKEISIKLDENKALQNLNAQRLARIEGQLDSARRNK